MFNTHSNAGGHDGAHAAASQDPSLNGWSSRLGMSFEEFEAIMSISADEGDNLQPVPANIAAGFVC